MRNGSPFGEPDFTREGIILFGKFKGTHVSELPPDYLGRLLAHYRFNLNILMDHKPCGESRPEEHDATTYRNTGT
jgi:hypothetical protein